MTYPMNCWYVAARSGDVGAAPLGRTLLEIPVLLYRREDGVAVAMSNVCSHRFAPLDRGVRTGDVIACKYHGLEFGPDGRCVRNPHGGTIAPNMHLRTFPVVESYGMVWFWPGDVAAADPARLPAMPQFEERDGQRLLINYWHTDYRHDILIDNLMDLSHADYLHVGSFSGGPPEYSEIEVAEEGDEVLVHRKCFGTQQSPLFPPVGPTDIVDVIRWHPGHVIAFKSKVVPAGTNFEGEGGFEFFHLCTPQDAGHTHYFSGSLHSHPADPLVDAAKLAEQAKVIEGEDGPMLRAVHEFMADRDLMDLRPVVLRGDAGALRVRRVVKRLIQQERQEEARVHAPA